MSPILYPFPCYFACSNNEGGNVGKLSKGTKTKLKKKNSPSQEKKPGSNFHEESKGLLGSFPEPGKGWSLASAWIFFDFVPGQAVVEYGCLVVAWPGKEEYILVLLYVQKHRKHRNKH